MVFLRRYGAARQLTFAEGNVRVLELHVFRGWTFSDRGEKVLKMDFMFGFFLQQLHSMNALETLADVMKVRNTLEFRKSANPLPAGFCYSAEGHPIPWSDAANRPGAIMTMGEAGLPSPAAGLIWLSPGRDLFAVLLPETLLKHYHSPMGILEEME